MCVHGFMSTSLFIFVAEENTGQIRKGGEPSRHILQKGYAFLFQIYVLGGLQSWCNSVFQEPVHL